MLPAFLEFARGCVMVAHNAPFDMGFLKHDSQVHGYDWPDFAVVDTALLARRVITPDETPNCKLGTLAKLFRTTVTPNHRALSDARATVDVLHGLFERVGSLGRADAGRPADVLVAGRPAGAGEAAPGRIVAARTWCVPLHRRPRRSALRRQVEGPAQPRPLVLHRLRDADPDRRDDRHRDRRPRDRVRYGAGGRGTGAAADRGAQTALQPAVQVPRAAALAEGHGRTVSAAVAGEAGPRRRRRVSRAVQFAEDRRAGDGRAARGVPDPAVHAPGCRVRPQLSPCVLAEMGRCVAPCDGRIDDGSATASW